jgi:hypothetical protein
MHVVSNNSASTARGGISGSMGHAPVPYASLVLHADPKLVHLDKVE